jgi:YHS domain-containing protein
VKMIRVCRYFSFLVATRLFNKSKSQVFVHREKAILGYDPVAFFNEGKMIRGEQAYSCYWIGVCWLFSTGANKNMFKNEPEKYAPQYGGFCAYGIARGYKAQPNLSTWVIYDNRLYFSYNQQIKNEWEVNRTVSINQADQQWPIVKDTTIRYVLPFSASDQL